MNKIDLHRGKINNTSTVEDIWTTSEEFIEDYRSYPFNGDINNKFSEADLEETYWQLISKYDESHYNYKSDDKCKLKTFQIIHNKLPALVSRVNIQRLLLQLTDDELLDSGRTIGKSAQNPDTEINMLGPDVASFADMIEVKQARIPKLIALQQQYNTIIDSLWDGFLDEFAVLFKKFMFVPMDYIYVNYEGEENE